MKKTKQLTNTIKDLVQKDRVKEALEVALKVNDKLIKDTIPFLVQQNERNERNLRMGLIDHEKYNLEKNRITHALVSFMEGFDLVSDSDFVYIVGFDLGDGESSITFTEIKSKKEPKVFKNNNGEESQVTALSRDRHGEYFIGSAALKKSNPYYLSFRFKDKPIPNLKTPLSSKLNDLVVFAETFFEQFLNSELSINNSENIKVYIGHPSGWEKESLAEYKISFENNRFIPNVSVVPESRAAFIQVKDKKIVTDEDLSSVLVVDIGSSTIDFTYVRDLEVIELSIGDTFGIGLLDDVISKILVKNYPDKLELEQRFEMYPHEESQIDYLSRKLKECILSNKFVSEILTENISPWVIKHIWENQPKLSEKEILETQIEKLGKSWKEYFIELLQKAKKETKSLPQVILITGGGSRAQFTLDLCKEIFGNKVNVKRDTEPHLCVSKGLARFGRWRYNVRKFHQDLNKFCYSEDLRNIVGEHSHKFLDKIKRLQMNGKIVENVWRPFILDMCRLKINPDEFQYIDQIKYMTHDWLSNTKEGQKLWAEKSIDFMESISPFIEEKTKEICEKYGIEAKQLNFELKIPESLWEGEVKFMNNIINRLFKFFYKKMHENIDEEGKEEIGEFYEKKWMKTSLDIYFATGGLFMDGLNYGRNLFEKVIGKNIEPPNNKSKKIFIGGIVLQIEKQLKEQAQKVEKYLE